MASPAYRRTTRHIGLWLLICFAGLAGGLAVLALFGHGEMGEKLGAWILPLGCIPFLLAFAVAVITMRRLTRGRHQRIADQLRGLGYQVSLEATPEEKKAFFEPILPLEHALSLAQGPERLRWYATRETAQGRVLVFEFHYVTGSGKSTQEHYRTVVALPSRLLDAVGVPVGWLAGFVMTRLDWLQRRPHRKSENADPGFAGLAKMWAIYGDTETGKPFLSEPVRKELATTSPKGESWCVGGALTCCSYREPMDAAHLVKFIARTERILATGQNPPAPAQGSAVATITGLI